MVSKALNENEDIQIRGIVHVIYALDVFNNYKVMVRDISTGASSKILDSMKHENPTLCLPFRMVSIHFCYNAPILRYPIAIFQQFVGSNLRMRFRCHYGSNLEVQYMLRSFGLLENVMPIDNDGNLKVDLHLKYLERLKKSEILELQAKEAAKVTTPKPPTSTTASDAVVADDVTSSTRHKTKSNSRSARAFASSFVASSEIIEIPTSRDGKTLRRRCVTGSLSPFAAGIHCLLTRVFLFSFTTTVLLGRGKLFQEYPGNVRLFQLVEKYRPAYTTAESNFEKASINQLIVKLVRDGHGRFLEKRRGIVVGGAGGSSSPTSSQQQKKKDDDEEDTNNYDSTSFGWIEVSDEVAFNKVARYYRK